MKRPVVFGVVKDGRIITSGICPTMATLVKGAVDGTPKLMETVVADFKRAKQGQGARGQNATCTASPRWPRPATGASEIDAGRSAR